MSCRLFEEEDHTLKYRLHRPGYPKQLFERVFNYYADDSQTNEKIPLAIDIGCGSGQASIGLSLYCDRVIGIDVSANQIAHGIQKDNVEYRCHSAEDLSFLETNSVDLITVAASLHWFNIEIFVEEVKRVLKPNIGVFAIWTYGMGQLDNPMADTIYREFDEKILLSYWNHKRWLGVSYYQSLLPLLPYKSTLVEYTIERTTETSIGQFIDFIETLSACQTFRIQEGEKAYQDLLATFRKKLVGAYIKYSNRPNSDETTDFNSIQLSIENPIRLYLMKKNEIN
ncbi:unnamed protein product [Rotaria magnacalcarata]|uniref:Methyltransferase type 11 domain-containing protein n=1 Tax=Rotaria magnacalcarata TaxID=392030 RepID=A0A819SXK7_9BILA|nr:unnamed protein product [Rotaria magnacalcarata]CAF2136394.1 unnamed protein product [Rotaria magnacalcarata]CAF4067062.1 unnamed protein product [Rotaria magnacalcarata]CAF4329617.1 unnamed protein product [Rotaria magnacalcarata]